MSDVGEAVYTLLFDLVFISRLIWHAGTSATIGIISAALEIVWLCPLLLVFILIPMLLFSF